MEGEAEHGEVAAAHNSTGAQGSSQDNMEENSRRNISKTELLDDDLYEVGN